MSQTRTASAIRHDLQTAATGSAPPVRIHGGQDAAGVAPHDFSTNSNACGPCPAALQAVRQADVAVYPDAAYTALRRQLGAFHGVDGGRILLAASASEFIFRISSALALRGAAAVWCPPHSYGDYAQAARAHGLAGASSPAQAALVWACEPSSPLGGDDPWLAGGVAGTGAAQVTVIDGAYQPLRLCGQPSLSAGQLDRVWQLFTPNKALGMTGVRAAYAIAPAQAGELAGTLESLCPSWPVGAHGAAMLDAWTGDEAQRWLADSLVTLRAWKARQLAVCASLGWTCQPSQASFFTAHPGLAVADLPRALEFLRARGIKLRDTASFGLAGQVRLGVLPPASQDALQQAWRDFSTEHSSKGHCA